jgi:hypothetical protein
MKKLTKGQMAQISGGDASSCGCECGEFYYCVAFKNGEIIMKKRVQACSASAAADMLHAETDADQVNCTKDSTNCGQLGD